jgi:hypothetical protein
MSDPVDDGRNPEAAADARRARVMVVCNPAEAGELAAALGDALSTGPIELSSGDGGDETLATSPKAAPRWSWWRRPSTRAMPAR